MVLPQEDRTRAHSRAGEAFNKPVGVRDEPCRVPTVVRSTHKPTVVRSTYKAIVVRSTHKATVVQSAVSLDAQKLIAIGPTCRLVVDRLGSLSQDSRSAARRGDCCSSRTNSQPGVARSWPFLDR